MSVTHYPGYLTKQEAVRQYKVQLRTINDRLRRNVVAHLTIDNFTFIKDRFSTEPAPAHLMPASLQWVPNFARRHNMAAETVYVGIVLGKINAVVVCNRVFVVLNEPELLLFVQDHKRK